MKDEEIMRECLKKALRIYMEIFNFGTFWRLNTSPHDRIAVTRIALKLFKETKQ